MTLVGQLIQHEGYKTIPYQDSLGVWTVGVGHNMGRPLSHKAIMQILQDDIRDATNDCLHAFPWFADLSEPRQWVMIDMCFNLGLTKLRKFVKFLSAMERGDYHQASVDMLDSTWARQVGYAQGQRAWNLAEMIRKG